MKLIFAAPLFLLLAACQTPCPNAPPQRSEVRYSCADGSELQVAFDRGSGRALVSEDGGAPFDLSVQIAGQGFRYAGDGTNFRGRGDAAEWTSPAGDTTACTAIASRAMAQSQPAAGAAASCAALD